MLGEVDDRRGIYDRPRNTLARPASRLSRWFRRALARGAEAQL